MVVLAAEVQSDLLAGYPFSSSRKAVVNRFIPMILFLSMPVPQEGAPDDNVCVPRHLRVRVLERRRAAAQIPPADDGGGAARQGDRGLELDGSG